MSKNEKFCIDCLGARVIIDTDIDLKTFFIQNKEKIEFPSLQILEDENILKKEKHSMVYRNSKDRYIDCNENSINVSYPYDELTDKNIAYLSKYLIEKQLGEMGLATCHSACVTKDGKAILLLGNAGAGKTSVALNLCLKKGYSLMSNDKTVIGVKNDVLYAFDGTKYLNLRYKSVKDNLPEFAKLFDEDNVESWTEKIRVQAHEIGIRQSSEISEIKDIIFLHIDNRENILKVNNGDTRANNFILYNNLSENIRASSSTFMDKKGHPVGYIPSYDSKEIYEKRVKIIEKINQNSRYQYMSGSLQDVLAHIENEKGVIEYER